MQSNRHLKGSVFTYSSKHKSGSPVGCRGLGHGHKEGREGPDHMTRTETGDLPIGLMTWHHSGDTLCSSKGHVC